MKTLRQDFKQWVEQEQVWDDQLFGSADRRVGGSALIDPAIRRAGEPASTGVGAEPPNRRPAEPSMPLNNTPARRLADTPARMTLQSLYDTFKDCTRCPLGSTRIKFVFGVGNPEAPVLFVGEGPGYEEDRRGEPFVGKAGQLLDKILAAIHLDRTKVYIANIVKCHPMQNPETPEARGNDRAPNGLEVEACAPILKQQIAIIQPKVIVTLGSPSTRMILQTMEGITKIRGRLFSFPVGAHYPAATDLLGAAPENTVSLTDDQRQALEKIQVLPTYHPAALLRNPDLKKDTWTDMKLLRDLLAQP